MATNFPTSLDTLTNPTSSDSLSSPSHSAQHANVNDAVEALQAKVGVDGSAVTSSLDYKLANIGTWTAYTPTFGSFTLGNGTIEAGYTVINKTVLLTGNITIGSTSAVSSNMYMDLPSGLSIDPNFAIGYNACGTALYRAGSTYLGVLILLSNNIYFQVGDVGATYLYSRPISNVVPATWSTGDTISWSLRYPLA